MADLYEKIENDEYKTKIPFHYEKQRPHDDMTIREARELEARERVNEADYGRYRNGDANRLFELFHSDLAAEYNLTNHPKEQLLFELACQRGDDFSSIAEHYEELSSLLR